MICKQFASVIVVLSPLMSVLSSPMSRTKPSATAGLEVETSVIVGYSCVQVETILTSDIPRQFTTKQAGDHCAESVK